MEFKAATTNDLNAIKEIEDEAFHKPFTLEELTYEIKENPFSKYILCLIDNKIVGFINFWITFDSATINQIATKKEYRNKGIATNLLKHAETLLKKENVEFFTLEVRESNVAAINLYLKFGFIKISVKKGYYDDGEDAIYMVKGEI